MASQKDPDPPPDIDRGGTPLDIDDVQMLLQGQNYVHVMHYTRGNVNHLKIILKLPV